jgi:hypothetical protein
MAMFVFHALVFNDKVWDLGSLESRRRQNVVKEVGNTDAS